MNQKDSIKDHESAVRKMISNSSSSQYITLETLEEAKATKNSYIIMEGDDGGQIYLVCPVEVIDCKEETLRELLKELDEKAWNDISMAHLIYEVHEPGSSIQGGMGGGIAENSLWVHNDFKSIKNDIEEILNGEETSFGSLL